MAMGSNTSASRALLFMRQCRINQLRTPQSTTRTSTSRLTRRNVSSSHLAPSNFSKPLRNRELELDKSDNIVIHNDIIPSSASPFQRQISSNPRYKSRSSTTTNKNQPPSESHTNTLPPPTESRRDPRVKNNLWTFIKHTLLNIPRPTLPPLNTPPFNITNNPYRARKTWPPDFRNLHPKAQFHFEKTFKRRLLVKTKSVRYNFNRYTKLLQQTCLVATVVYFVFIADPYEKDGGGTPMDGFRGWFFGQLAKSNHLSANVKEHAAELEDYYRKNASKTPEEITRAALGGSSSAAPAVFSAAPSSSSSSSRE